MTGSTQEGGMYGMYPRPEDDNEKGLPPVTCDSRDETGFNPDLELHRVDRGRLGALRDAGGSAVHFTAQTAGGTRSTHDYAAQAFNGGPFVVHPVDGGNVVH